MPFELVADYLDGKGRKVFCVKTEQGKLLHCMREPDARWLVEKLNAMQEEMKLARAAMLAAQMLLAGSLETKTGLEAVSFAASEAGRRHAQDAVRIARLLTQETSAGAVGGVGVYQQLEAARSQKGL